MSHKTTYLRRLCAATLPLFFLSQAHATCGMPAPKSSLGEYEYGVAFISGILPGLLNESDYVKNQITEEYIEFIVGLSSIVEEFSTCFTEEEMIRAKHSILLAAAALNEFPISDIASRKDVVEILERQRTIDFDDYESVKRSYHDSIKPTKN